MYTDIEKKEFGIFIQARLTSTRLPKKVILPFFKNKSIIELINDELKKTGLEIIYCIPKNKENFELKQYLKDKQYNYFEGDEDNVTKRIYEAALKHNKKYIVRICSDNPFISSDLLLDLLKNFNKKSDYCAHFINEKLPAILTHFGLFSEITKLSSLKNVLSKCNDINILQHVTNFIYCNESDFLIQKIIVADLFVDNLDKMRFTVDTKSDFILLKELYESFESFKKNYSNFFQYLNNEKTEVIKLMTEQIKLNKK